MDDYLKHPMPDTILLRYWNPTLGLHFYTNLKREIKEGSGYIYEGAAGYVQLTQVPGSVPLLRYVNVRNNAHFYTINPNEVTANNTTYKFEDYAGYVYSSHGYRLIRIACYVMP